MTSYQVESIGNVAVENNGQETFLKIAAPYRVALKGLTGFSHLVLVWWCHELDAPELRSMLTTKKPYKQGPEELGIFATRSPVRPNPIAISVVEVLAINEELGEISVSYVDAHPDTPILDIKPYFLNSDYTTKAQSPEWCQHWPQSIEESASFDWEAEFNFEG